MKMFDKNKDGRLDLNDLARYACSDKCEEKSEIINKKMNIRLHSFTLLCLHMDHLKYFSYFDRKRQINSLFYKKLLLNKNKNQIRQIFFSVICSFFQNFGLERELLTEI